jgi:LysM repeat protein
MWLIAQKYGAPYDALIVFNPQIPDPNQITPGQVLKVPATHMEDPSVYTSPSTGGSSSSPNTDASSSGQQKDGSAYTVKTGDSLWKIAQQFGVTIEEISAANPSMKDKDFVYPGQLVNIPVWLPAQWSIKCQVSSSSEVQKRSGGLDHRGLIMVGFVLLGSCPFISSEANRIYIVAKRVFRLL